MAKSMKRWRLWLLLAGLLMGCSDSVTLANFERIQPGMTTAEVEAILGPPTQSYQGILTWSSGGKRIITVILDDRKLVAEKDMEGL